MRVCMCVCVCADIVTFKEPLFVSIGGTRTELLVHLSHVIRHHFGNLAYRIQIATHEGGRISSECLAI